MQQYAHKEKERCRHTPLSVKIKCILLHNRQKVLLGIHHSPAAMQPQLGTELHAKVFHSPPRNCSKTSPSLFDTPEYGVQLQFTSHT